MRVSTDRGRTIFLRINEGKTEQDVRYEADLVRALAARGVKTPVPFETQPGALFANWQGKLVSLFPWIAGHHVQTVEVTASHAAAVGAALAELHRAGADFAERRKGIYTLADIERRFCGFQDSADPVLAPAVTLLGAELERLSHERPARWPEGIIHQDLFRDNVLFGADETIAALLDFEQAVWGRFAYDLAVCVLAWCFRNDRFDRELVQALRGGYEAVRPLQEGERAQLAVEARRAAVRFTVTRITDVYLRGAERPDKDFRSYLARLRALDGAPPW